MKKSELKEIIKSAMLEGDDFINPGNTKDDQSKKDDYDYDSRPSHMKETLVDADQDIAEAILNALGGEEAFEAVVRAMSTDDAQIYLGGIMRDYDIEMEPVDEIPGFEGTRDALNSLGLEEAEEVDVEDNEEVDVDIEKDVEVDDESVESDIEVDASMPGESADEVAVQSLLMKAQEEAAKLGDEKLTDQIGNTITYFTRAHVATVDADVNENMLDKVTLPSTTTTKANGAIINAPTMGAVLLKMYNQLQSKEQTDFSQNADLKIVIAKLTKLANQVPTSGGGGEGEEKVQEIDEIAALPGADGVEDVNIDDPAKDAMVGLTESLRWRRIAGIAKDNGLYDNLK